MNLLTPLGVVIYITILKSIYLRVLLQWSILVCLFVHSPVYACLFSVGLHGIKQQIFMTVVVSMPLHMSSHLTVTACPHRSTILQQQFNRTGKVEHGSVALPAVMRSGSSGPETFNVGSMPSPQQQVMVGQMHRGHMPPLVRLPGHSPCTSGCCLWCAGRGVSMGLGCVPSTLLLAPVWILALQLCSPDT